MKNVYKKKGIPKSNSLVVIAVVFILGIMLLPLVSSASRVVAIEEVVNLMLRNVTSLQEQAIQNNDFRFNSTIESITSQIRSLRGVQGTVVLDAEALTPTRTFAYGTPCMYDNTVYPDGAIRSIGQFARQEIVCRHGFWVADRVNMQLPVPNLRVAGGTDGEVIVRFTTPSLCYRISVDFGDGTIQRNDMPQDPNQCSQLYQTVEFSHQYQTNQHQRIIINIEDKWVSAHNLQRGIVTIGEASDDSNQIITNGQVNQDEPGQCSQGDRTDTLVVDDITMRLTGAEYQCQDGEYIVTSRGGSLVTADDSCEGILDVTRLYPNGSRVRLSHVSGTMDATCQSGNWDISANLTF